LVKRIAGKPFESEEVQDEIANFVGNMDVSPEQRTAVRRWANETAAEQQDLFAEPEVEPTAEEVVAEPEAVTPEVTEGATPEPRIIKTRKASEIYGVDKGGTVVTTPQGQEVLIWKDDGTDMWNISFPSESGLPDMTNFADTRAELIGRVQSDLPGLADAERTPTGQRVFTPEQVGVVRGEGLPPTVTPEVTSEEGEPTADAGQPQQTEAAPEAQSGSKSAAEPEQEASPAVEITGQPPRTKAMQRFLEKERGRVVAVHIGEYAVRIYTRSDLYTADDGSGTFFGASETAAIKDFNARIQPRQQTEAAPETQPESKPAAEPEQEAPPASERREQARPVEVAPGSESTPPLTTKDLQFLQNLGRSGPDHGGRSFRQAAYQYFRDYGARAFDAMSIDALLGDPDAEKGLVWLTKNLSKTAQRWIKQNLERIRADVVEADQASISDVVQGAQKRSNKYMAERLKLQEAYAETDDAGAKIENDVDDVNAILTRSPKNALAVPLSP